MCATAVGIVHSVRTCLICVFEIAAHLYKWILGALEIRTIENRKKTSSGTTGKRPELYRSLLRGRRIQTSLLN